MKIANTKIFFVGIFLTILIFSCAKESQNGGIFKVRFTFSPPLTTTTLTEAKLNNFIAEYTSPDLKDVHVKWESPGQSNSLTSIETPEVSVLSGQNITLEVWLGNLKTVGCNTVKVEGILNNKVSHNFTKELGFSGDIAVPCKDQKNYTSVFINFPIK
jgi:hypothetical protein